MNLYLFDVDHTLEFSNGPVKLEQLVALKKAGHTIGLCGNWGLFTQVVHGWEQVISLMNVGIDKATFMDQVKTYCRHNGAPYERYVMIGNDAQPGEVHTDGRALSSDKLAAHLVGWEFIAERDFMEGL